MTCRVFTVAAAISLLFCAVAIGLWARSYRHVDGVSFWTSQGLLGLNVRQGRFSLDNEPQLGLDREVEQRIGRRVARLHEQMREVGMRLDDAQGRWQRAPDRFTKGGAGGAAADVARANIEYVVAMEQLFGMQTRYLRWRRRCPIVRPFSRSVPCGTVVAATALLPAARFAAVIAVRRRRSRRRCTGRCVVCGYSLTGNTSGVCPECGTPTIAPARPPQWRVTCGPCANASACRSCFSRCAPGRRCGVFTSGGMA